VKRWVEQDDFAKPGTPDAFGLMPSPYNYAVEGKKPMSSTCASIVEDVEGEFSLAIGGSGGSRIFSSVAQTLLNLDWGYDLSHAIEEPRVHDQLLPAEVGAPLATEGRVREKQKG
jgi:gamma-glutamyltranspeptidase/glutathione hydrolase/leukotriene-C4 hydrolase